MMNALPDHLRTGALKPPIMPTCKPPKPDALQIDANLKALAGIKRTLAKHHYATYRAYLDAGFSEAQSIDLLKAEIAAQRR